jgi:hypothetical protein
MSATMLDLIRAKHYENTDPFPQTPRRPIPVFMAGDDKVKAADLRAHADKLDAYEIHKAEVELAQKQWRLKHEQKQASFVPDLEAEFGVAGNPKAAQLYDLAWDYGHSGGLEEVYAQYSNLVDLIR